MSAMARVVLQDAKHAIARHTDTLQAEAFRISWLAVIAALRAVGHVLDKVDGAESPAIRRAVDESWSELLATRPEPKIFWGFIDYERNRFLKNYEHGIVRTLTVPVFEGGGYLEIDGANSRGGEFSPGSRFISFISSGPYEGREERAVAWEAHAWWEDYLDRVDHLAASYGRV
jgi:hypothetical protein